MLPVFFTTIFESYHVFHYKLLVLDKDNLIEQGYIYNTHCNHTGIRTPNFPTAMLTL